MSLNRSGPTKKKLLRSKTITAGAGCSCDCKDEMADDKSKYGSPEEVSSYDSGDYHSVSCWWWSKGVNKTYTWGGSECCDVSTYTFDPITKTYRLESVESEGRALTQP